MSCAIAAATGAYGMYSSNAPTGLPVLCARIGVYTSRRSPKRRTRARFWISTSPRFEITSDAVLPLSASPSSADGSPSAP